MGKMDTCDLRFASQPPNCLDLNFFKIPKSLNNFFPSCVAGREGISDKLMQHGRLLFYVKYSALGLILSP